MVEKNSLILIEKIERAIFLIRRQKVMLDRDLAQLYGVETKTLNRAFKRNIRRFPEDFAFQLTQEEHEALRYQFGTLKQERGRHRKYLPYAFSEQGVAMLSSVLKSERAIDVNVEIMRTFVRLRYFISSNKELAHKIQQMEKKYDSQFKVVFDALRQLMEPPKTKGNKIGFK